MDADVVAWMGWGCDDWHSIGVFVGGIVGGASAGGSRGGVNSNFDQSSGSARQVSGDWFLENGFRLVRPSRMVHEISAARFVSAGAGLLILIPTLGAQFVLYNRL
jgi:hypothetical protein